MSASRSRIELALPARRREAALGERQIRRRHVEPHPPVLEQRFERDAVQLRRSCGIERLADERQIVVVASTGWSMPMRAASSRKISLFGLHSPSGVDRRAG